MDKKLIGLVNSLLRHSGVDCGLPEVASVGDGRVVDAGGGGGVRRDERLLVHGRGRDDLRRRHLLHRLQRLLPLRLVDVRRRAPVGRNLRRGEKRFVRSTQPLHTLCLCPLRYACRLAELSHVLTFINSGSDCDLQGVEPRVKIAPHQPFTLTE